MVEVRQADREAAADYHANGGWGDGREHWLASVVDSHPLIQAFARRRIAAENAAQQEITALRARIAEDQAQIAALTTYRENLRDEVIELRARIAELEAFQQQAIKQVCELAREAGEAKGKLEASELPGIVDDWREKCERLERRVAELEAERAEWVEVERLRMGKPTPPTPPA